MLSLIYYMMHVLSAFGLANSVPSGPGGSREYLGRGPTPGTGRCFNCGNEGHWARDCKAGDWKNKCYHCGERGHIERNCQNSPKKHRRGRSYSRSPSPCHGRSRSRSYSRSRSHSRSRSIPKKDRSIDRGERRSRSPPSQRDSPPPLKGKKRSPTPERNPRERGSPSLSDGRRGNERDYSRSPNGRSWNPRDDVEQDGGPEDRSPVEENGHSHSFSPRDNGSPIDDDGSPRGSE